MPNRIRAVVHVVVPCGGAHRRGRRWGLRPVPGGLAARFPLRHRRSRSPLGARRRGGDVELLRKRAHRCKRANDTGG